LRCTFSKAERLSSKKVIERLFKKGSPETGSVFSYPFRVLYLREEVYSEILPDATPVKPGLPAVLISVSKRNFKRAVDRNLIKRRIREAYRLNKALLFSTETARPPAYIAFVYVAKEILGFEELEKKMKFVLRQMK